MDELFPEYLTSYLNPTNICLENLEEEGSGYMLQNGLIILRRKDSLEQQTQALLHELTHMHPNFISYTGCIWSSHPRNEKTESLIEKHANKIYKERPNIVNFVKKIIAEAKGLHSKSDSGIKT
jgi:hypothetical protein